MYVTSIHPACKDQAVWLAMVKQTTAAILNFLTHLVFFKKYQRTTSWSITSCSHIVYMYYSYELWISKWNYIDIYIPSICISARTSLTGHQGICGVQTSGSRPSKEASVWFLFDINFSGKDIWKDVGHQFEEIRLHQFCDQLTFCQHQRFRSHRRGVTKWPYRNEHRSRDGGISDGEHQRVQEHSDSGQHHVASAISSQADHSGSGSHQRSARSRLPLCASVPSRVSSPDDLANEANIVTKVKHLDGSLRRPWQHLGMHQEVKDAITLSVWLMTEGRIWTDNINESYIIGFNPSTWSSFHQLLEIKGISGFTRITHHHMASF